MRYAAVTIFALAATGANAQFLAPGNGLPVIQMGVDVSTSIEEQIEQPSVFARPAEAASDVTSDANFVAVPARTQANLAHFVAQARAASPSAASELERLTAQVDVVGAVSDKMRSVGLQPNNTADAYAVWWIIAWSAAQGRESPEDAATFQAVSRQARAAFAGTDGFARLPDADKQQFAEALMVQAVLLDSANDQTRGGDPALRQQLAAQARRGASEMGLDLTTMTLTPKGFRPRKGADASPGEEHLASAIRHEDSRVN